MISPGFEKAAECFDEIIKQSPPNCAAQVVVHQHGQRVVDLASSTAGMTEIHEDTPFLTFSVSKAFTAAAVWSLIEQGRLELDAPVMRYWPEFGCGGKETATLRHVFLHQAGIPAPHLYRQVMVWPSWRLVTRSLAREKAQFRPGTKTGYHLVNYGFILGEVVRRVTGMPIDEYLQETFFKPMGLTETWMRIPAEALRHSPRILALTPETRGAAFLFNRPGIRRALLPAVGLHSSARGLATFFQMLLDGGEYAGGRYLRPETIALAAQSYYDGYDLTLQRNMNWGLGLIMGGGSHTDPEPRNWVMGYGSSAATFAAMGYGTCMVWADRSAGLVTAFTCNGMLVEPRVNRRWAAISNAVWDCVRG